MKGCVKPHCLPRQTKCPQPMSSGTEAALRGPSQGVQCVDKPGEGPQGCPDRLKWVGGLCGQCRGKSLGRSWPGDPTPLLPWCVK